MLGGDDAPHISVAAGITVGLLASLVQSFGLTIQRLSHVANDKLPVPERKRDWQRPLWLGGFAIFILSNVFGTLFQIGALPIVVLGPLGAVSLLWNAAFAKLVLGDEFTVHLVVGTVLIAGGAVLIGIFGVVPEQTHTLPELVKLYERPPFIIWISLLASFVVLILSIAHLTEWRLSKHLSRRQVSPPPSSPGTLLSTTSLSSPRAMGGPRRKWSEEATEHTPLLFSPRTSSASSSSTSTARPLKSTTTTRGEEEEEGGTIRTIRQSVVDADAGTGRIKGKSFSRLTFAENEFEADSNNLYSPTPSIVGGGSRPRSGNRLNSLEREEEEDDLEGGGRRANGEEEEEEEEEEAERRITIERTRVWIGAAYGATSGTLSGLCLLFTKTGIELLIMSIVGKTNQFGHFEAWLIVIVLLVCELFQLAYLNRALRLVGPTLVCPLAFCFYNTCSIVSGLIYYNQWDDLTNLQIGLVTLGIAVLLGGVWIVSIKSGTDDVSVGELVNDRGERKNRRQIRVKEREGGEGGSGRGDGQPGEMWLDRQDAYVSEPDSELERGLSDEESDCVAEDDEPLEWRPRGFSIGLGAASPGFDLRPHYHRQHRRRFSTSASTLPHHSTLDAVIRDATSDDRSGEGGGEGGDGGVASPSRRRRREPVGSCSLATSRSMRGSLSGSLYVGPTPCPLGGGSGHRRSRSSGTTISLPTTPLVGAFDSSHEEDEEEERGGGDGRGGKESKTSRRWWKLWR